MILYKYIVLLYNSMGYSGYTYFAIKVFLKNCLLLMTEKKYEFYIKSLKKQSVTETFLSKYDFY